MTENTQPDLANTLFDRIDIMVQERGADISTDRNGNALRLGFADGQRIVINIDSHASKVWLASRAGGTEFELKNGVWRAHDQSEFLQRLSTLIEQTLVSVPTNASAFKQYVEIAPSTNGASNKTHSLRNLLILTLAVLVGFWLAQRTSQPQSTNPSNSSVNIQYMAAAPTGSTQKCEASLPANGSINIFSNGMRADGPNDAEVTLKNDHAYPLLLILAEPDVIHPPAWFTPRQPPSICLQAIRHAIWRGLCLVRSAPILRWSSDEVRPITERRWTNRCNSPCNPQARTW
jgi:iron donor protein CyaY